MKKANYAGINAISTEITDVKEKSNYRVKNDSSERQKIEAVR